MGQTNTYSCPNEIRTDFSDIVYTALLYIPEALEGLKIRGAISSKAVTVVEFSTEVYKIRKVFG